MVSTASATQLEVRLHPSIEEINSQEWNALSIGSDPFLRYEFLSALERNQCLGKEFGWHPYHIALRNAENRLIAAAPLYIKTNSYGEFVFDWSWASAYEQARLEYYPKLVCSIPYNPVTGARLLTLQSEDTETLKKILITQSIKLAEAQNLSGMHWLFTDKDDTELCKQQGLSMRLGCQYHWRNHEYKSFDHFLENFASRKRKKVRRERRRVAEQDIQLRVVSGAEASEELICKAQAFYEDTFDKKSGIPTLTQEFFLEVCATMGEQVVFIFASHEGRDVACAICFRSDDALFGRFWGCERDYHSLHFETCFYQGIDYCIAEGLQRFEPGAPGEHQI